MRLAINAVNASTFGRFAGMEWAWGMNNPSGLRALSYWPAEQRMVVVTSVDNIARVITALPDCAWLGYNIEAGTAPAWQIANPGEACRRGHVAAARAGLGFAVLPSYPVSQNAWQAMLPHCECYGVQGKGLQAIGDAAAFGAHLAELAAALPAGTELWGDVAAAPKGLMQTAGQMAAWVDSFATLVSGTAIFAAAAQYPTVAEFVQDVTG